MKRKLKWLAIVLAVSLLGFGTALLLWPRDRITAESWQKIRIGMTEEEVVEILGGAGLTREEHLAQNDRLEKEPGQPPFQIENFRLEEPESKGFLFWDSDRLRIWNGRRGMIVIELDEDSHVRWKHFQGGRWDNGNILDRVRDWLGW
jgi:hypothetical protein